MNLRWVYLVCVVTLAFRMQGSCWSAAPERVGTGSYPDLALDADGNPHVVYVRGDSVFVRSRGADGDWGAEQQVPIAAGQVERSDPELAIDSQGRMHILCGSQYAWWDSAAWTAMSPRIERDTALALDGADTVYLCRRGGDGDGDLGVLKRAAGATEFTPLPDPDTYAGRGMGTSNHVYGHVFAGNAKGTIHVVYRHHHEPLRCGYRYSTDGGKTWDGGGIIDDDFEAPSGAVAPDGTVYIVTGSGIVLRLVEAPDRWESLGRALATKRRDLPSVALDASGALYVAAFGGRYNIYRNGHWQGETAVPRQGEQRIGNVSVKVAKLGAWVVWEENGARDNKQRVEDGAIYIAQVSPHEAGTGGVGQWDRFEATLENNRTYADPYRDVGLDVTYTRPDGSTVEFWGFYDGGSTWRARFMPDQIGPWHYEARFSDDAPGASGSFMCVPSERPGMVTLDLENPAWFGFSSGQHFLLRSFHVGDRFFAANWPAEQRREFLDWLMAQGYNTLSIASHYLNRQSEGRGEGWDTPKLWPLNAAEYREAEAHLDELARRGLIVFPFAGFFGHESNFPKDPADQEAYVRYTLARFGAYWNVLLNVAGPEPRVKGKLYLSIDEINQLGTLIQKLDVFGHPLSVHNKTGEDPFRDAPWLSYGTLQGPKTLDRKKLSEGLLELHHPKKPLYAQETLWTGNLHHKPYTDVDLRKNAFVIAMSGAALNFGDMNGNSSSGFSGTLDMNDKVQSRHDIIKDVWDLFETLPFYRMHPAQELVDAGYCLAEPGRQYLVYLDAGGVVNIAVTGGAYRVQWIDAQRPGHGVDGGKTTDGRGLEAPAGGDDWILQLTHIPGTR